MMRRLRLGAGAKQAVDVYLVARTHAVQLVGSWGGDDRWQGSG